MGNEYNWVFRGKSVKETLAVTKNVQGQVAVRFIVDSTGLSQDVAAIDGPEALLEESVQVVKKVSSWVPAIMNGRKVNSWKTQRINFRFESH